VVRSPIPPEGAFGEGRARNFFRGFLIEISANRYFIEKGKGLRSSVLETLQEMRGNSDRNDRLLKGGKTILAIARSV